MSKLNIDIPHQLSKEEALGRIKGLLVNLKQEQKQNISDVKEKWEGDTGKFSFRVKGFELAGAIQVSPSNVVIRSNLPFGVSLFKGKIKSIINQKAKELLS